MRQALAALLLATLLACSRAQPPAEPETGPSAGQPAPPFTLPVVLPDGSEASFDLAGALEEGPVVLLFIPQPFTPGCDREAKGFCHRSLSETTLVAVTSAPVERLKEWVSHYGLSYRAASDPTGEVCRRYGSWDEDEPRRTVFVVEPGGTVAYRNPDLDLATLEAEIDQVIAHVRQSGG